MSTETTRLQDFQPAQNVTSSDLIYAASGRTLVEQATTVQQLQNYILSPIANSTSTDLTSMTGGETIPVGKEGLFQTTIDALASFTLGPIATASNQNAAALTGNEALPLSQGGGLFQSALSTIAAWVINTFPGFTQSGTGAVARTLFAKLGDFPLSPEDFGAKGDGLSTTDDGPAINACIAAAGALGATVVFKANVYSIQTPLVIGNGSNGVQSTVNGVKLVGQGSGTNDLSTAHAGTLIRWWGAAGATMLTISGPGGGFGIDGITFDCNGLAAEGWALYSTRNSSFRRFGVLNFTATGIAMLCRTGGGVQYGENNVFENFIVASYGTTVQYGWFVDGDYANNVDWYRNTWINGITQVSAPTAYAASFKFCDHNTFINTDFQNTSVPAGTVTTGGGVMLNGYNNNYYPQNLFFYGCSISNVVTYEQANGGIGNNTFYNFTTADQEKIPNHPKLRGITDMQVMFGPGYSLQTDLGFIQLLTQAGQYGWRLLNNSTGTSQQSLQLQYTSNNGATWTTYFEIDVGGDVWVNLPGIGLRAITAGAANSGGTGYRQLLIAN
jgi:hypothetical protein